MLSPLPQDFGGIPDHMNANGNDPLEARQASGPEIDEQKAQEVKDAYAAAWRYALGQDVEDIGAELDMSRATVYRLLKEAQEHKLLDTRPRVAIPRGAGAQVLLSTVLETHLGRAVRDCFPPQVAPFEVLVASNVGLPRVPAIRSETDQAEAATRFITARVGMIAARRLMMGILNDVRIVGINWGFHCYRVSHSLPGGVTQRIERDVARDIRFFPLVGSLGVLGQRARDTMVVETSANANAARCVANLSQYGVLPRPEDTSESAIDAAIQLTQPCVIPENVARDPEHLKAVWRYIALDKSVQAIFGRRWGLSRIGEQPTDPDEPEPLLQQADALITGISAATLSRAVLIGAIEEDLLHAARRASAVAEISAHYICHARDYPTCSEDLREVNKRVVAPTLEDYVDCTRRARVTGRGMGTMLVSNGNRKAEAVVAAITNGAVNILVCDENLARAVIDHVESSKITS